MFDANLIIWIVVCLAVCTLAWNTFVLVYANKSKAQYTKISEDQPLIRWIFEALRMYVVIKIALVFILTTAQVTRNYYLIGAVGTDVAPEWLFWVVVMQNLLFYGLGTLPAVFLYAFTWAITTVDKTREDRIDENAREYLGLEKRAIDRLQEKEEGR